MGIGSSAVGLLMLAALCAHAEQGQTEAAEDCSGCSGMQCAMTGTVIRVDAEIVEITRARFPGFGKSCTVLAAPRLTLLPGNAGACSVASEVSVGRSTTEDVGISLEVTATLRDDGRVDMEGKARLSEVASRAGARGDKAEHIAIRKAETLFAVGGIADASEVTTLPMRLDDRNIEIRLKASRRTMGVTPAVKDAQPASQ